MPTDAANIEVARRIRDGALGPLAQISTLGVAAGHDDPPKTDTIESRMQSLTWDNDLSLSGGYINAFDIHALGAAIWVLGQRPVSASGVARICRPHPHGDSPDVCSVVYEYADGLVHNYFGQALPNNSSFEGGGLQCRIFGQNANALMSYGGRVFIRGGQSHHVGDVKNLYLAAVERNIAMFHRDIVESRCENETAPRAVDGVLTVCLGRDAGLRRTKMTMDEPLKENRKLEVDLSGRKA